MYFDIFFLIVFAIFIINGYRNGFIKSVFSILGIILAVLFTQDMLFIVKSMFEVFNLTGSVIELVSYVFTFVLIYLVVVLAGYILQKLIRVMLLGFVDKLLGIFLGFLKGLVLSLFVVLIFTSIPDNFLSRNLDSSFIGKNLKIVTAKLFTDYFPEVRNFLEENLNSSTSSGSLI